MNTTRTKTNPIRSRTAAVAVLGIALSVGITSATASSSPDDHPAAKGVPDGSVTTAKLRNGAVTAPKLRDGAVATSKIHNDAVTGPKIHNGAIGPSKLAPAVVAPRAVGTIWWTGTSVTNNRVLKTANVSHPVDGVYCLSGLSFTPINALATPSFGWNASHNEVHVWAIGPNQQDPCPTNTQVQVRVYQPGTTMPYDSNFNIMIF